MPRTKNGHNTGGETQETTSLEENIPGNKYLENKSLENKSLENKFPGKQIPGRNKTGTAIHGEQSLETKKILKNKTLEL